MAKLTPDEWIARLKKTKASAPTRQRLWKSRPGRGLGRLPFLVSPHLRDVLVKRGMERLYKHRRRRPCASSAAAGMLCWLHPPPAAKRFAITRRCCKAFWTSRKHALFICFTKALAQDQMHEAHGLITDCRPISKPSLMTAIHPMTRAGPSAGRGTLSSPIPTLHAGILPHHTKWQKLFCQPQIRRDRRTAHLPRHFRFASLPT